MFPSSYIIVFKLDFLFFFFFAMGHHKSSTSAQISTINSQKITVRFHLFYVCIHMHVVASNLQYIMFSTVFYRISYLIYIQSCHWAKKNIVFPLNLFYFSHPTPHAVLSIKYIS